MLKDIGPTGFFNGSLPGNLTVVGNTLYFTAREETNGNELWKSDGTTDGTILVADIMPGPSSSVSKQLVALGDQLIFVADNGINGKELWAADGTPEGTSMVMDINPGAPDCSIGEITAFGGNVYFRANDGTSGTELWKSDGTGPGTMMVADLNEGAGSSNPGVFTPLGDQLLFTANDGTAGFELWASDGTANDTSMVDDINPGPGSSFLDPVSVPSFIMVDMAADSGTAFFAANDGTSGMELWNSDGTPDGTALVKDILPGPSGAFDRHVDEFYNLTFANLLGNIVFVADDGVHGLEPWVSDGTDEGTQLIQNVNDTPLGPESGPLGNTTDSSSSCYYGFQALLGGAFGQCHQAITGWELWTVQADAQPVTCGRGELQFNATIVGTDGDDLIHGTPDSDVIHGLGGNDGIFGLEGDDIICGGPGNDVLKGDQGNDTIYGNSGKDKLMGGEGKDELMGGTGKDRLVWRKRGR